MVMLCFVCENFPATVLQFSFMFTGYQDVEIKHGNDVRTDHYASRFNFFVRLLFASIPYTLLFKKKYYEQKEAANEASKEAKSFRCLLILFRVCVYTSIICAVTVLFGLWDLDEPAHV